MSSVVPHQLTAEDGDDLTSLITTDRVLKLTSYLLQALIQVTETFTEDHESRFLQILYYAFPDVWLRDVEMDPESRMARIEAENEPPGAEFEDADLEAFDESALAVTGQEKVIYGRMDAEDAQALVGMLDQLLFDVASGEQSLNIKSLAAVYALRCQLLTPQGQKSTDHPSPDAVTFSRWLIEEVDRFTNGRGMARDLKNAFPGLLSVADADRSAGDLLQGEMDKEARETLVATLNDVLDADLAHSESGGVIEAVVCLLS